MSPILEAALQIQAFCQGRGWRFCFIGGIVVPRWGEPRMTAHADLTLLTGFGGEEAAGRTSGGSRCAKPVASMRP